MSAQEQHSNILNTIRPLTEGVAVSSVVDTLVKGAKASSKLGDYVWETSHALLTLASDTPPSHQENIIQLIIKLRKNTVRNKDRTPLRVQNSVVWADLPDFANAARDLLSTVSGSRKVNYSSFLARLTSLSTAQDDPFDYHLFALWLLRDAFESATPVGDSDSATGLRVAAVWVQYAGKALRLASTQQRSFPGAYAAPGDRFQGIDWKGFNEERWAVWRDGFRKASAEEAGDAETKEIAKRAGEAMDAA